MKFLGKLAVTAALSCVALATPAAAQQVTNGGFENGNLTGWTVVGDHTSAAGTGFDGYAPHTGDYFAALGDTSGTGSLSQVLSTVAGETYTLSYYLASSGDQNTSFSTLWNGQTLSGSALTNPNSFGSYTLFSFLVTGTGSDTLTFRATDVPSYMALDDVSITPNGTGAVPEPGTWAMMLVGFAGIGLALRRKRKPALMQIA
jgi:hypothetical protein